MTKYEIGKYDPNNVNIPLNIHFNKLKKKDECSIYDVVNPLNNEPQYCISEYEEYVLSAWDEFYKGIKEKVIGFPIWSYEFKGTYDLSYIPTWKADFIQKNRNLYKGNREFIEHWLKNYDSLKKF